PATSRCRRTMTATDARISPSGARRPGSGTSSTRAMAASPTVSGGWQATSPSRRPSRDRTGLISPCIPPRACKQRRPLGSGATCSGSCLRIERDGKLDDERPVVAADVDLCQCRYRAHAREDEAVRHPLRVAERGLDAYPSPEG